MTVLMVPVGVLTVDVVVDGTPAGAPVALGEVIDCTFTMDVEETPVYSNESCEAVIIHRIRDTIAPVIECMPRNWSDKNIAMLLSGTIETTTGVSTIQVGNNRDATYLVELTQTNCADGSAQHVWTLFEAVASMSGAVNLLTNRGDRNPQALPLRFEANFVSDKQVAGSSGYGTVVMPETT